MKTLVLLLLASELALANCLPLKYYLATNAQGIMNARDPKARAALIELLPDIGIDFSSKLKLLESALGGHPLEREAAVRTLGEMTDAKSLSMLETLVSTRHVIAFSEFLNTISLRTVPALAARDGALAALRARRDGGLILIKLFIDNPESFKFLQSLIHSPDPRAQRFIEDMLALQSHAIGDSIVVGLPRNIIRPGQTWDDAGDLYTRIVSAYLASDKGIGEKALTVKASLEKILLELEGNHTWFDILDYWDKSPAFFKVLRAPMELYFVWAIKNKKDIPQGELTEITELEKRIRLRIFQLWQINFPRT